MIGAVTAKPNLVLPEEKKNQLYSILRQFDALVVSEDMGSACFASDSDLKGISFVSVGPIEEKSYPLRFEEFVGKASLKGAEVVVTIGGDGIASYSASAIIKLQGSLCRPMGILGFPAGTANVGPIVRPDHDKNSLNRSARLDSIEVRCADKVLGYGFNDVIIGRSFLGTMDNRWVNLCAKSMAERGEAVECLMTDEPFTGRRFSIKMNGEAMDVPAFVPIRQICVSTLHQDNLFGRAVIGGLIEASGMGHPAAIALLDKVSNDARPETWNQKGFRTTSQMCFESGDVIELEGFADGVCVIIDGNPFVMQGDRLVLRCVPDSVKVFGIGR